MILYLDIHKIRIMVQNIFKQTLNYWTVILKNQFKKDKRISLKL